MNNLVASERIKILRLTITAVGINCLAETEGDEDVDGDDVQVASDGAVQQRWHNGSDTKEEDLNRMRILCC